MDGWTDGSLELNMYFTHKNKSSEHDKAQRIPVYSDCIVLLHRLPLDSLEHLVGEHNSLLVSSIVGNASASHLSLDSLEHLVGEHNSLLVSSIVGNASASHLSQLSVRLELLHQLGQSAPEIVGHKLCPRQVDDEATCGTKGEGENGEKGREKE